MVQISVNDILILLTALIQIVHVLKLTKLQNDLTDVQSIVQDIKPVLPEEVKL